MKLKRNGIWPCPVYVATFADGTTGRCSFYSPKGKPIDVAHGRKVAGVLYARPDGAPCYTFFQTYPPRQVTSGHVEWNGETIADDMGVGKAVTRKANTKPSTAVALKRALAALQSGNTSDAIAILQQAA